jgi:recombination protein RecR
MQNNIIDDVAKFLSKLPSLGPRASKRLIIHLLNNKEKNLQPLIDNLQKLYHKIASCRICGNFDENEICYICSNPQRNHKIICVVEEVADIWAIERSNSFKGCYHVLSGKLSAISNTSIEDLKIKELIEKIKKDSPTEIIIATSATIDGQTTAHYIVEILKEFNLKVTKLSYGIPIGSELDYLDEGTINIAFKTRSDF